MSLHIELTDEAKEELESMRKKSLFSSIVVSVLTFTFVTILFITLKIIIPDTSDTPIVTYSPPTSESYDPEQQETTTESSSSSSTPTKFLAAANVTADVTVPDVPLPSTSPPTFSPSTDIGIGTSTGQGIDGGGNLPPIMVQRCSAEDRIKRIKASGGSEKFEASVVKSLQWIKKTQQKDGSWGQNFKAAMTGMSLLAYLAHCETPYSEEFGDSCLNAITYLLGLSKKHNGFLSPNPTAKNVSYEHAVATYALAEAYTFCQSFEIDVPGLKEAVEKAGEIIARSQSSDGSWMYYYRTKGGDGAYPDLSVSGWNIQAVKAIKHSPAKFDSERVLRRAETFVKKMGNSKTGLFSYKEGDPRLSMVPVGVLSLQMMEAAHLKESREGVKLIAKDIKPEFNDAYTYYYTAQALMNNGLDQDPWKNYGKKIGEVIVSKQKSDGSWPAGTKPTWHASLGGSEKFHYFTALTTLTLEVYYRFLPATGEGTKRVSSIRN